MRTLSQRSHRAPALYRTAQFIHSRIGQRRHFPLDSPRHLSVGSAATPRVALVGDSGGDLMNHQLEPEIQFRTQRLDTIIREQAGETLYRRLDQLYQWSASK